eukprot:CAMPEP_0119343270 /NCGR_PEP_ID=MMETSP1333-20130426/106356_1 /TAXON_ID=418940 /ORGANISM="Scyphosphaera apsteinii, Strain RCC1455" /LENGTH=208 /DNA_ID=CAMNT_0007355651 /DNA_START=383 /DNA_END=1009 /DNA_ORIENTATION=+
MKAGKAMVPVTSIQGFQETHSDAATECAARGLRLCTYEELATDTCCNTGCRMDQMLVWSNTSCVTESESITSRVSYSDGAGRSKTEQHRKYANSLRPMACGTVGLEECKRSYSAEDVRLYEREWDPFGRAASTLRFAHENAKQACMLNLLTQGAGIEIQQNGGWCLAFPPVGGQRVNLRNGQSYVLPNHHSVAEPLQLPRCQAWTIYE